MCGLMFTLKRCASAVHPRYTLTHLSPLADVVVAPQPSPAATDLISHEAVRALGAQLDNGASIEALRRFDRNLRTLTIDTWGVH
jgi:hypothetical protein